MVGKLLGVQSWSWSGIGSDPAGRVQLDVAVEGRGLVDPGTSPDITAHASDHTQLKGNDRTHFALLSSRRVRCRVLSFSSNMPLIFFNSFYKIFGGLSASRRLGST